MTIADLSTVWVSAEVPESLIRLVQIGERFDVTLSAFPGEVFKSRVARIEDAVDLQMRTIEVWAELPNGNGRFRPGMFGEVRHVESLARMPVVPAGAVIQAQGRNVAWIEESPGSFRQVQVTCGKRVGDVIPVHAGLKAGDRVVVDGAMLLRGR
jgi:cobalt-zinc-cadmium efflux system membrane fusion protein